MRPGSLPNGWAPAAFDRMLKAPAPRKGTHRNARARSAQHGWALTDAAIARLSSGIDSWVAGSIVSQMQKAVPSRQPATRSVERSGTTCTRVRPDPRRSAQITDGRCDLLHHDLGPVDDAQAEVAEAEREKQQREADRKTDEDRPQHHDQHDQADKGVDAQVEPEDQQ